MGTDADVKRGTLPTVTCPGCRILMAPAMVISLPRDRIDVTYRCGKCSTETARTFKCGPA